MHFYDGYSMHIVIPKKKWENWNLTIVGLVRKGFWTESQKVKKLFSHLKHKNAENPEAIM